MLAAVKQRACAKRRNAALHYEIHRMAPALSKKIKKRGRVYMITSVILALIVPTQIIVNNKYTILNTLFIILSL